MICDDRDAQAHAARKMSRVRLGEKTQKKMTKVLRAHRMVIKGYSLEHGIKPEEHEVRFTIEKLPRVLIVGTITTVVVADLSLDEAIALAMKGLQASVLIGALTGEPVTRADISEYAQRR